MPYRAGDRVEVRSLSEILATLDADGCLDGMPFMPEMRRFCGRRMRVGARAHKTCDTVRNIGGVRVSRAVHLEEARCDGSAHDGCQAACLLFWKEQWLRPADTQGTVASLSPVGQEIQAMEATDPFPRRWSVTDEGAGDPGTRRYRCQATELPSFVSPLRWWDIRQYFEDLTSGNIGLGALFRGTHFALFRAIVGLGVGYRMIVATYNGWQKLRGGSSFPFVTGKLQKTPHAALNLQPGETVRVRGFDEVMATLDSSNKNRGLGFDTCEMRLHCGKTYQVDRRIERIINERDGRMLEFRSPSVTLRGVYCSGETTNVRMFCPRAITPYWREIWLERVGRAPAVERLAADSRAHAPAE